MIKHTIILIVVGVYLAYWSQCYDCYVQPGTACVASDKVARTMRHFGYNRDYRILPSGELQVKLNGTWQRLHYRKEK